MRKGTQMGITRFDNEGAQFSSRLYLSEGMSLMSALFSRKEAVFLTNVSHIVVWRRGYGF